MCVHRQTGRRGCLCAEEDWEDLQAGSDSGPAIAAIAGAISTYDSNDIPGGVVYFDDTIVAGVEDEQIAIRGNSYASRVC